MPGMSMAQSFYIILSESTMNEKNKSGDELNAESQVLDVSNSEENVQPEQSQEEMIKQLELAIVGGLSNMSRKERRKMYRKGGNFKKNEGFVEFTKRVREQKSLSKKIRSNQLDTIVRVYEQERSDREEKMIRNMIESHGEERGIEIYEKNLDLKDSRDRELIKRKKRRGTE